MAPSETPDPGRFLSHVDRVPARGRSVSTISIRMPTTEERSVAGLRRRRRRATNDVDSVDEDRLARRRGRDALLARRHPRARHGRAGAARRRGLDAAGRRDRWCSPRSFRRWRPTRSSRPSAPSISRLNRRHRRDAAVEAAGSCAKRRGGSFELQDDGRRRPVLRAARCSSCMARSPTPPTCWRSSRPRMAAACAFSTGRIRGAEEVRPRPLLRASDAVGEPGHQRARTRPRPRRLQRTDRRRRPQPRRAGRALVARSVRQLAAPGDRRARARRAGGFAAARHLAGGARQDSARDEPDLQRRHVRRKDAAARRRWRIRSSGSPAS